MMPAAKRSLIYAFHAFLVCAVLVTSGCSVLGVKVQTPAAAQAKARRAVAAHPEHGAADYLRQASQPGLAREKKLAALVEAARLTQKARPGTPDQEINRLATAAVVVLMQKGGFEPAHLGEGKSLTIPGGTVKTLDPRTAQELLLASSIRIRGLRVRVTQAGAGVPCVARFTKESPVLSGQPGIPPRTGICEPVTALLRFDGKNPQLVFYRTLKSDDIMVAGRKTRLAADFSAPLAYMVSRGENRLLSLRTMLFPNINPLGIGLYQFSAYDPEKIPVIFVHGLMSRPETWIPAVNELLADKKIREHYQFWFFIYPTGLPVWTSAAKLRSEIERYHQVLDPHHRNRYFNRTVLAGHSMGGLLSGLQVRSGGEHLWRQFLDIPPSQLNVSPKMKEHLLRVVEFGPRPEISRVVFFATPHRGSTIASKRIVEIASRLIRLPFDFLNTDFTNIQKFLHPDMREILVAPANSLVFLRAHSPLLTAILNLPIKDDVPYHSIIGDRGRGDTPNSSDGIVPYWSSHLEGAASEKIVPSGHSTNENPEGIEELRRILRLHWR